MRQIFPAPVDDVDPVEVYAGDRREALEGRPWLLLNMISSVDGAVAVDGLSGGLGGPADQRVFGALRAVPDVILVASGTVIAENYRRPQTPERSRKMRLERGQSAIPRLAIVTNSLDIDAGHRVFDPEARPLVITRATAPAERQRRVGRAADIVHAGQDAVDLEIALRLLFDDGARVVLAEGGPTLNGSLVANDLVDEMCLSMSPMLVGGEGPRIVRGGSSDSPRRLRLDRILEEDGLTFHRYLRS